MINMHIKGNPAKTLYIHLQQISLSTHTLETKFARDTKSSAMSYQRYSVLSTPASLVRKRLYLVTVICLKH